MKIASACLQCRRSKRKCLEALGNPNTACIPCQQRSSKCSKAVKLVTDRSLAPSTAVRYGEDRPEKKLHSIPSEAVMEFVDLYMLFMHDRPHSLFHAKSLWKDIQARCVSECLLTAVCAVGCRFSAHLHHRDLATELRARSSLLFSQQLESITVSNIQTCVLLANLYAAEQNNELEALYFGIANRMARVLRFNEVHVDDPPILREVKCRIWWTLFMADRWCPPGLGLTREIPSSAHSLDLPMDEYLFQMMDEASAFSNQARSDGLWKYMITLVDILGPIQDLNQSLIRTCYAEYEVDQQVAHLAGRLDAWNETLPEHMRMNDTNFDVYRSRGHGGTFVALHLGYHHYCTLLFFQYLDAASDPTVDTIKYATNCRFHALSFSRLLHCAREQGDCHVVYLTVAHMTMVSSSVLLHMLLFGNDGEVETARRQLTYNFEALVDLRKYWPHMDQITQRLLAFQDACLQSSTNTKTHQLDRWMVRFLLEHALPLGKKDLRPTEETLPHAQQKVTSHSEIPFGRTEMLNNAFADLCKLH